MSKLIQIYCVVGVTLALAISIVAITIMIPSYKIDPVARDLAYVMTLIGHPESDVKPLMKQRGIRFLRRFGDVQEYRQYMKGACNPPAIAPPGDVLAYRFGPRLAGALLLVFLDKDGNVFAIHVTRDRF